MRHFIRTGFADVYGRGGEISVPAALHCKDLSLREGMENASFLL